MTRQQRVSTSAAPFACLLVLAAALFPLAATAFLPAAPSTFARTASTRFHSTASSDDPSSMDVVVSAQDLFPDATILNFTLQEHKPLGCTVEESLAHANEKHIFVTKLVEDGFAQAAGLQVGDVLLAVPGIFGDLTDVPGLGIEQVKSFVSGREESEPLILQIARGTDVMEAHEDALVELCMTPGANDDQVEECLTTIMSGAYFDDSDPEEVMMGCDGEEECLLDDLYAMWEEDMPTRVSKSQESNEDMTGEGESTPAPWSSRSSPSGTYQRDPATGEMKRTDS